MASSDRRVILRVAVAATLICAAGLSACGRKGPLEPPKADVTTTNPDASPKDQGKPDRSFPLDFLL